LEHDIASEEFVSLLSDDVFLESKKKLDLELTKAELHQALLEMALNKSLGPDGFIIEFYKKFWYLIGSDFFNMIQESISNSALPTGMNRGTIALLYKGVVRDELGNWRLISLLNVGYKILAKALQCRLQTLLAELISLD